MDPEVFDALQRWADDDLRSLNGQIEYVLRNALRERQRVLRRAETPERRDEPPEPGSE